MKLPLSSIIVGPRQRIDLGDLSDTKASMADVGLINPITVDQNNLLLAGRRRLECAIQLGWTEIDVYVKENLDDKEKQIVELDEDIIRKDRTWQEKTLALYKLFWLHRASDPSAKLVKQKMMSCYGLSVGLLSESLRLGKYLTENIKEPRNEIAKKAWAAASFNEAYTALLEEQELLARRALEKLHPTTTVNPASILPGGVHTVNETEEEPTTPTTVVITINDDPGIIARCKCAIISGQEFNPNLRTLPYIQWLSSIHSWEGLIKELRDKNKKYLPFPLVWNRINGITWKDEPFSLSYWLGLYVPNGYVPPPDDPKLSAVIACTVPKDSKELPVQVVQYCLDAMSQENDLVWLEGDILPVVAVAQCGRTPVWDGTNPANTGLREKLEAYYRSTTPNVEFL